MPNTLIHESRRLLLPFDTVVDALIELDAKHGRWPAGAEIVEVSMVEGANEHMRSVALSVRSPGKEETAQRTYQLPTVAAAIVNYCLTMRVPMPRGSSKSIQILPEGIVLMLEDTLMFQRRHKEPPAARTSSAQSAQERTAASAPDSTAAAAAQSPAEPATEPAAKPAAEQAGDAAPHSKGASEAPQPGESR